MSLLNDALRKRALDNKPTHLQRVAKGLGKRKTAVPSMVFVFVIVIVAFAIAGTTGWVLFMNPPVDAGVTVEIDTYPSGRNPGPTINSEYSDSPSIMGLASAVTNSDPAPDHIANFRKSKKNTEKAVSNDLSGKHRNEAAQTLLSTVSEPLTAAVNEVKNTEDMLSRSLSEKRDNIPRNRPDIRPFNSTPRITSGNPQDIVDPMDGPINDPTNDPIDDLGDRLSPSERLYQKGQAYHRQNRYYQAIQMYEGVLELHPDHEAAQFNLASAYIAVKDYSGAKPLLETLSQDGKDNAELLLNLSIVAIGTGDPEAALKYLAQLEQKSPRTNFDLFFHRGVAYRHLDKNEKAFEWYRRAYQLNSNHPQLVFNMAVACDVLKKYAEAIEYYAKYIELFEDIQSNEERQIKRRISQLRTFTQVNLNRH